MLDFIKKIFGLKTRTDVHPLDGATRQAQEAPYKLEPMPMYRETAVDPETKTEPKLEVVESDKKPKKEKTPAKPKKEAKPKAEKPTEEKTKKPKAKKNA